MKVVFLGATKGMGRALARKMALRGDALFLLGRDLADVQRSAADLTVRGGRPVGAAHCDLEDPRGFAAALDAADERLGRFNTVLFSEEARRRLLARGGGTLCVFSSVAGERGRKPVILYGAAKAGLTRYLEGLDHKFRAAGLRVVCIKPGFVKTGMTEGLKPPPFAGEPDAVAAQVVAAIDRGKPVVYA